MAGEGSLGGATLTGYRAGASAAKYSLQAKEPTLNSEQADNIEESVKASLGNAGGGDPIDLEEAVRGLKTDYVGYFKEEGLMLKGLDLLLRLRKTYLPEVGADDTHGLVRCAEVRSLFDVSEMHIRASLARKETRYARMGMMNHIRLDYPERDPNWRRWIVVKRSGDQMTLSTREVPRLKADVRKAMEDEIARRRG
jgi:succinate dehydrogenase/fumarate reductase flavoprotein subunit